MTLQRAFISIHAPQWGATRHALIRYGLSIYFNPRTPVGCDMAHVRRRRILWISIHAPQWGATGRSQSAMSLIQISIHAPQWGATHTLVIRRVQWRVSIHAPQWGATMINDCPSCCCCSFNPRTPVGCDLRHNLDTIQCDLFQSTHPSGVRQAHTRSMSSALLFQSTHPSGVRPSRPRIIPHHRNVSIHAPQWGATITRVTHRRMMTCFNPRTPVGCDASCSNALMT